MSYSYIMEKIIALKENYVCDDEHEPSFKKKCIYFFYYIAAVNNNL